jgi:hypothetical protein
MYKATSKGVIEFGPPIELTEEDRNTIAKDIGSRTSAPILRKRYGKWSQHSVVEMEGYRVFIPED